MAESKKRAEERRNPRAKQRSKLTKREKESIVDQMKKMEVEGVRVKPKKRSLQPGQKKDRERKKRLREERIAAEGGPRKCEGFNLAGEPCQTPPLTPGKEFEGVKASGRFCLVHDPEIDQSAWRSKFIGNARPTSPLQALTDAFAKAPQLLFEPHFKALGLEWDPETREAVPKILPSGRRARGAVVIGFSREGIAKKSKYEDIALQTKVSAELQDRMFGKPRQAMDIGMSAAEAPKIPATGERAAEVTAILQEAGAL